MSELLTILNGDCREMLKTLPDESVHCVVTSPPYFGLRDYGVDGQIGLEPTPESYIETIVEVFQEVRRVLRTDGTVWLNLGDSFWGGKGQSGSRDAEYQDRRNEAGSSLNRGYQHANGGKGKMRPTDRRHSIIKPKDLCMIPHRTAIALQQDGWWVRSDIVWAKPNPMPESVEDRPTRAHEYIFLLSRTEKYWYDHEAIKEPCVTPSDDKSHHAFGAPGGKVSSNHFQKRISGKKWSPQQGGGGNGFRGHSGNTLADGTTYTVRNKRSVWEVTTRPYDGAHFATFPPDLIKPCILAGCPVGGMVLDPFAGSGTTGKVALELGRKAILIELNPEYIPLIEQRCTTTLGLPLGI